VWVLSLATRFYTSEELFKLGYCPFEKMHRGRKPLTLRPNSKTPIQCVF
jgi:hypothetical protein